MSANKEPLLKALSEPIPHVPVEEPSTASQAYIYDRADRLTCGYDATIINSDDERRNAEHIDSGGNSHHIDSGGNNCHIDSAGSNRPNRADGNKDNCNLHTGLRRNTRSRTVGNSRGHNRTHHSIRRNTARLPTAVRFQALAQSRPSPIHHNGRHASRRANAVRLPRRATLPMIQAVQRLQQSSRIISEGSYAYRPPTLECCFVLERSQFQKPLH